MQIEMEPREQPYMKDDGKGQQRLSMVKDVLKNSKTLKEQLKGVCACYDEFV